MPTDLLTIQQALALVAAIPDVLVDDAKRQAEAVEIVRQRSPNGDSWKIQIPRSESTTLPSGRVVREGLSSYSHDVAQVATATVEIGGYRIPVILAHAILGAYYVALERGDIVPAPVAS